MATADEYAAWIVKNADKRGTPDFDTVAQAYELSKMAEQAPAQQPDSLGRQAGLFARSSLRAVAGIPQIVTEPLRRFVVNPLLGAAGLPRGSSLTDAADQASDYIGFPKPQNRTERIVDKAVEFGMGAAGMARLANKASQLVTSPAVVDGVARFGKPVVTSVLEALGTAPGTQAVAGATGGAAGQQAKENGAGWIGQLGSTVLGGLAGAGIASGVSALSKAALNRLVSVNVSPSVVDNRIVNILTSQGIDPRTIGPAILSQMREDVAKAIKKGGELDADAVARLADYARVNATPTRGTVTLDPYTVTMQKNAEKLAASTGSRDARLPMIANENNRKLIEAVAGLNPSDDIYGAGSTAIGGVTARDAAMSAEKNALYDTARATAGGDIPLSRKPYMDAVFGGLVRENKLAFLPENVGKMINQISAGQITVNGVTHQVPFNVNTLDNLKTVIATASRSADGNGRAALKIVRDALESVPLEPVKNNFGGSQVVNQAGAAMLREADSQPSGLMAALDAARGAARRQFAWQESAPGIEAALGGANPATFVKQHVISTTADAADVSRLVQAVGPQGQDAMRGVVAQHLLDAAIGAGKDRRAANFSGVGLQKALASLGDRKLALFFSPDEIELLKSAARVGNYETFQPRGSAVNNSNTGAAIAQMLQGISKYAKPIANKLPFGESAISNPLNNLAVSAAERPALNIVGGLLMPSAEPAAGSFAAGLLGPSIYAGSLLAEPRRN